MQKINKERLSDRDNYIRNRNFILEDYKNFLEEVERDEPSVDGLIAGSSYQDFALIAVFRMIKEQKEYTTCKADYIDLKEEKVILRQMIKDAKKIFKKDFDKFYNHFNKEDV
jgi:hypothetical protein